MKRLENMRTPPRFALLMPAALLLLIGSCSLDLRGRLIRGLIDLNPPVISAQYANEHTNSFITITAPVPGAAIRYTIDGSDPSSVSGKPYSRPFYIGDEAGLSPGDPARNITVRAVAQIGGRVSAAAEKICKVRIDTKMTTFSFDVNIIYAGAPTTVLIEDKITETIIVDFSKNPEFAIGFPAGSSPPSGLRFFYTSNGGSPVIGRTGNPLNSATRELERKSAGPPEWRAPLLRPRGSEGVIMVIARFESAGGIIIVHEESEPYSSK